MIVFVCIKLLFKKAGLFVFLLVNAFIFDFGILFVDVFMLPPFKKGGFSFFFILEFKLFTAGERTACEGVRAGVETVEREDGESETGADVEVGGGRTLVG